MSESQQIVNVEQAKNAFDELAYAAENSRDPRGLEKLSRQTWLSKVTTDIRTEQMHF